MRLVDDMVDTMYDAVGAGLAAPQVGVQKRLFVYDVGDGPEVMINPDHRGDGRASGTTRRAASPSPGSGWGSCGR